LSEGIVQGGFAVASQTRQLTNVDRDCVLAPENTANASTVRIAIVVAHDKAADLGDAEHKLVLGLIWMILEASVKLSVEFGIALSVGLGEDIEKRSLRVGVRPHRLSKISNELRLCKFCQNFWDFTLSQFVKSDRN
jgi:hypothetical protein